MTGRKLILAGLWALAALTLARCGASSPSPTAGPTPGIGTTPSPSAFPSASPTPGGSSGLPAGMVCSSPTPPPMLRMHLKVHGVPSPGVERWVLDSKPLVPNVDGYCDKVGFGDWKFCDTRPEGHPEREACDFLVVGQAEDTQRWGPTWYFKDGLCALSPNDCANHQSQQFQAVAKSKGVYEACAAPDRPVASNGSRCGTFTIE